ncbi:hypothetical protein J0X14_15595 [Muricauda sp. CAU 1633]|uniref:hypothetical protein n=1 Tax=Allomuricauda sp. CAU 1633 TaxID=2816036 RepID=UPI001A8DBCF6|nr:hypothetical protein [Muricauda sp. CAU 1633]MBO0323733.1 hypothetical protein [Muricauda sp. CAU 1633]
MRLKTIRVWIIFIGMVCLASCKKSDAERYVAFEKEQLQKGVVQDSLFLGLYFGMSKKEFREYCFEKNIQKQFWQGGRKNTAWVESKIEGMEYPAAINFYPSFTNDTITEMNASIYYNGATYKDGTFESDSLLLDVLQLMDHWYGGKTFKVKSPVFYKNDVHVHLKGNCRITISPDMSGQLVNLWYYDLKRAEKHKS